MVNWKITLLAALLFISNWSFAQDSTFKRKYILDATATFSPGIPLGGGGVNYYLLGYLEYFPENNASLRGDISYSMNSSTSNTIQMNHDVFWSAFYHFGKERLDIYAGLGPGVGLVQLKRPNPGNPAEMLESNLVVTPAMRLTFGGRYFVGSIFNFFLETAVHVKGAQTNLDVQRLDEFRVALGLGFNLKLKKDKK